MKTSTKIEHLNGSQLQHLQDRFQVVLDLEDGTAYGSREHGTLTPETVAKMVGMKEIPANWSQDGKRVKGL